MYDIRDTIQVPFDIPLIVNTDKNIVSYELYGKCWTQVVTDLILSLGVEYPGYNEWITEYPDIDDIDPVIMNEYLIKNHSSAMEEKE